MSRPALLASTAVFWLLSLAAFTVAFVFGASPGGLDTGLLITGGVATIALCSYALLVVCASRAKVPRLVLFSTPPLFAAFFAFMVSQG